MEPLSSVSAVRRKIGELEEKRRLIAVKLEKAVLQKKDGARYYHGTELPIDDVIFSIREGQARSLEITLDFYRQTLHTLAPAETVAAPVGEDLVVQ